MSGLFYIIFVTIMKKLVWLVFSCLLILWWCNNSTQVENTSTKSAIAVSGRESSVIASWWSFTLFPIDGFNVSPAPTDEYNTVMDFLFVDYDTKEIGIRFFAFMPNKSNLVREERMNSMGVPYENIYPALKYIYINEKERERFPKRYWLPEQLDLSHQEFLETQTASFYYQPIVEADFESFMLWTGWVYAADKNNVYILFRYDVPMLNRTTANYKVLEEKGIIRYPFYHIISGADPKEGNRIDNPFYLVQSNGVWYKGIKLEGANPSGEILYHGANYFVQNEGVWFENIKVPTADPATFKKIEDYLRYTWDNEGDALHFIQPEY